MATIIITVVTAAVLISLSIVLWRRWAAMNESQSLTQSQLALLLIIIIVCIGSLAYRALVMGKLEQTSALFIGLPALLAAIVVLTPAVESATGMILKGLTIALLISGIFLGEGLICILMSAPLFYLVGAIIGLIADRRRDKSNGPVLNSFVLLPFVVMSLEGITPELSFERAEVVSTQRIISADVAQIRHALAATPSFNGELPLYLQLGFPRPVKTDGSGLEIGALRKIHFAGGEGKPGDLLMQVEENSERRIVFRAIQDTSHVAHWMDWKRSIVELEAISEGETRVHWTIEYDRRLDPAWYFAPWERYAVELAADYLIQELATPKG